MKLRDRFTWVSGALFAGLLSISHPGIAVAQNGGPTNAQLLQLIQQQQRQLEEMKAALQRTKKTADTAVVKAEEAKTKKPKFAISDYISIGGLVEVEATETEAFNQDNTSDIALSTVELSIDATPNEWLTGHILFLYEEDGTDTVKLDEAFGVIGNTEKFPVYLQVGKSPIVFGNFDTDMSADPLTLSVAEAKEISVMVGATAAGFSAHGFIFNGDTQTVSHSNHIDQFGISLGYETEVSGVGISVGAGYINNIADSDTITTALGGGATSLSSFVGAAEGHATISYSGFTVRGSYLSATDRFLTGELAFGTAGSRPVAWHTEASYTAPIGERDVTFALTLQGTEESLALGLPEQRIGGAVTIPIIDPASITFEYLHDEDYSVTNGGTGNDSHTATLKFSVEF